MTLNLSLRTFVLLLSISLPRLGNSQNQRCENNHEMNLDQGHLTSCNSLLADNPRKHATASETPTPNTASRTWKLVAVTPASHYKEPLPQTTHDHVGNLLTVQRYNDHPLAHACIL